jgi:hypothetical protein
MALHMLQGTPRAGSPIRDAGRVLSGLLECICQRQRAIDAVGGAPLANPIKFLAPALEILSSNVSILPATGGAVEDLQHPVPDEIEDALINRDAGEVTTSTETPTPTLSRGSSRWSCPARPIANLMGEASSI